MRLTNDSRPLDSTRQAFDAWIAARPGTAEYERAKEVALLTAASKFQKANRRMATQLARSGGPAPQTEKWQPLATRHLASALVGDPELWRTLNYEQAKQIVLAHGYLFEPNPKL
jgi:hypothetical protein